MPLSESGRSQAYRQRMRASGLRPIQIWVPDTTREDFAEQVRRQVDLLRGQAEEQDVMDFLEAAQDANEWD